MLGHMRYIILALSSEDLSWVSDHVGVKPACSTIKVSFNLGIYDYKNNLSRGIILHLSSINGHAGLY